MIYTVTLNPSLDYMIEVDRFKEGITNRNRKEDIYAGGKGINVSKVVKEFGKETCTLGFVAGFTGKEIERELEEYGLQTEFISVSGFSRINVKMKSTSETEINGKGPCIQETDIQSLFKKMEMLKEGDILVLSGSVPAGISEDIYFDIMKLLQGKDVKVVVDGEGKLLMNSLSLHPFLIKPNDAELAYILQKEIHDYADAINGAVFLREQGARNVIVTLGSKGAVFVSESGAVYVQKPVCGTVVSTVGAGDSVIGGFLANMEKGEKEAFRWGCAAGSATCFMNGLCTKEIIEKIVKEIEVEQWR